MADLLAPRGGAGRPWDPLLEPGRDPEPDRAAVAGRTSAADSSTEAPTGGQDWLTDLVDQVPYPTRMARRRALQNAQPPGGWEPDPKVTGLVLEHVEAELDRLFQRPWDEAPGSPQVAPAPVAPPQVAPAQVRPTQVAAPAPQTGAVRRPGSDLFPDGGAARQHRPGRLRGALAALVAVLLVAGVAAVVVIRRGAGPAPAPARSSSVPAQQLLAVSLAVDGQITGVSLLAAGPGGAQQVLVPGRLLLDVPGAGRIPVARSLAVGSSAPGAAVADALGVRVSAAWVLDVGALASLVDRLGGVTVDVDVDVPVSAKAGSAIMVPAGDRRRLTGKPAAAYAGLIVGEEPEAARLARQERVLTAVLAGLPAPDAARRALLAGLAGAPRGAALSTVVAVTGALREPAASGSLPSTVLPVNEIDSGGAVTAYGLDAEGAARLTRSRLAGAAIAEPVGGRVRVLVQNGVGTPGLGEAARAQLVAAGLRYVGGGNVTGFGVRQTVVLLADGGSAERARGAAVARALGLGEGSLRITDSAPTVADVVVVLGADYRPA